MPTATATREDRVGELVQELHAGVTTLTTTDGWQRFLTTAARFHRYSFLNTLAILIQRPDATRVAGYQQWRRLGRQVRRGETGIRILAPCTYRVTDTPDDTDADPNDARVVLRGWRVATVFDIAQTDGEALPEPPVQLLDGDAPTGLRDQLAALIRNDGFDYQLGPIDGPGGALGRTNHLERTVVVRDDLPPAQQAKTTAHELAHVRLHGPGSDRERAVREIEAESVAFVVCGAVGLATDAYSFGYLATWANGDTGAIRATGERVIAASRQILDSLGLDAPPDRPD